MSHFGGVEVWRGGLGGAYLLPTGTGNLGGKMPRPVLFVVQPDAARDLKVLPAAPTAIHR